MDINNELRKHLALEREVNDLLTDALAVLTSEGCSNLTHPTEKEK